MNSKIIITFNDVPVIDTELIIVDALTPALQMRETFKQSRTQAGETIATNTINSAALYYSINFNSDYSSINYTVSRINNVVTIESSNENSAFSVSSNTTLGRVTTEIINAPAAVGVITLPVENRTPIDSEEQITFVNSPVHIRLQNAATDSTIEQAYIYLWVWNGAQNKVLGNPNITLFKKKVSAADNYINLEVADYIKAFIENPLNAPNTNQPNFVYNEATAPAITGLGVFWQIIADITSNGETVRRNYETNFATLGYRWNYEQNAIGNNGLSTGGSTGFIQSGEKWYNSKIHSYIKQSFDLTKSVEDATAGNMIVTEPVAPPADWKRCSRDSSLIVYINKAGLWDMFTPHGKITASGDIDSEEQNRAYRDPSQIDNTFTHSKLRSNIDVLQSYVINTGSLTESMVNQVEQIIFSPKIYLILFNGDVQEESTVGITIDNTFVTIDDTNITIDSATVESELLGLFKSFRQIPVISMDKTFQRKTRINDRNEINYNLKLAETNNKVLDNR